MSENEVPEAGRRGMNNEALEMRGNAAFGVVAAAFPDEEMHVAKMRQSESAVIVPQHGSFSPAAVLAKLRRDGLTVDAAELRVHDDQGVPCYSTRDAWDEAWCIDSLNRMGFHVELEIKSCTYRVPEGWINPNDTPASILAFLNGAVRAVWVNGLK
jgi:hypothetical protein